jgi:hypothetical protein
MYGRFSRSHGPLLMLARTRVMRVRAARGDRVTLCFAKLEFVAKMG